MISKHDLEEIEKQANTMSYMSKEDAVKVLIDAHSRKDAATTIAHGTKMLAEKLGLLAKIAAEYTRTH